MMRSGEKYHSTNSEDKGFYTKLVLVLLSSLLVIGGIWYFTKGGSDQTEHSTDDSSKELKNIPLFRAVSKKSQPLTENKNILETGGQTEKKSPLSLPSELDGNSTLENIPGIKQDNEVHQQKSDNTIPAQASHQDSSETNKKLQTDIKVNDMQIDDLNSQNSSLKKQHENLTLGQIDDNQSDRQVSQKDSPKKEGGILQSELKGQKSHISISVEQQEQAVLGINVDNMISAEVSNQDSCENNKDLENDHLYIYMKSDVAKSKSNTPEKKQELDDVPKQNNDNIGEGQVSQKESAEKEEQTFETLQNVHESKRNPTEKQSTKAVEPSGYKKSPRQEPQPDSTYKEEEPQTQHVNTNMQNYATTLQSESTEKNQESTGNNQNDDKISAGHVGQNNNSPEKRNETVIYPLNTELQSDAQESRSNTPENQDEQSGLAQIDDAQISDEEKKKTSPVKEEVPVQTSQIFHKSNCNKPKNQQESPKKLIDNRSLEQTSLQESNGQDIEPQIPTHNTTMQIGAQNSQSNNHGKLQNLTDPKATFVPTTKKKKKKTKK